MRAYAVQKCMGEMYGGNVWGKCMGSRNNNLRVAITIATISFLLCARRVLEGLGKSSLAFRK